MSDKSEAVISLWYCSFLAIFLGDLGVCGAVSEETQFKLFMFLLHHQVGGWQPAFTLGTIPLQTKVQLFLWDMLVGNLSEPDSLISVKGVIKTSNWLLEKLFPSQSQDSSFVPGYLNNLAFKRMWACTALIKISGNSACLKVMQLYYLCTWLGFKYLTSGFGNWNNCFPQTVRCAAENCSLFQESRCLQVRIGISGLKTFSFSSDWHLKKIYLVFSGSYHRLSFKPVLRCFVKLESNTESRSYIGR